MKITVKLNSEEVEIPESLPTPRVIRRGSKVYIGGNNYEYNSVGWYDENVGILYDPDGMIVLEGSR